MADLLTPCAPSGACWTVDELRALLDGEPTITRFTRGYVLAFVERDAGPENTAVTFVTRGDFDRVRGPALIMHMDEAPVEWQREYNGLPAGDGT